MTRLNQVGLHFVNTKMPKHVRTHMWRHNHKLRGQVSPQKSRSGAADTSLLDQDVGSWIPGAPEGVVDDGSAAIGPLLQAQVEAHAFRVDHTLLLNLLARP